ncbi:UDP-3-O-(3-hydroxymyristoyl)glucosamine N-acyltransferase [Stutzerimonas stutzeri]|jgi:UDP-3-O-[3-hydroxymyristoyl] glucosamine N-acyltransferase|uniref:UDP-3-O-(3-hydroxymyristoyl)glucosamine N-acyltransferase n=1 Tax=Stutzerimonas stutzeri TaxID=316 RepID=UPI0009B7C5EF|nr:UDP-3-O-(3-hydroxymyristoyl)glucosamine N-acyltransferase [Stutzerimonas stutzeri]
MGYRLRSPVRVSSLCQELDLRFTGADLLIEEVSGLSDATATSLTFSKTFEHAENHSVCICPTSNLDDTSGSAIFSSNPRLDFVRALVYLVNKIGFVSYDFDSEIDPTVEFGKNVVVERGCRIGKNVIIEHNVVIQQGTTIGNFSRIRANSSIGGNGFGFERLADGTPIRFPHLGGVVIGENVEIGALNSIARGTLGDTILEDYVKTDNLVHIAHNCFVQRGAFLTACAELSGGVTVGRDAWIGPNASIIQKVNIGQGALVGIGAVVTKDVEDYAVFAGNPARRLPK